MADITGKALENVERGMVKHIFLNTVVDPYNEADEEYPPSESYNQDYSDDDQDQNTLNIREDTVYPDGRNLTDHRYLAPLYGGNINDQGCNLQAILGNIVQSPSHRFNGYTTTVVLTS